MSTAIRRSNTYMSTLLRSNTLASINSQVTEAIDDDTLQFEAFQQSQQSKEERFVSWDGPGDVHNPLNWPAGRKWVITLVCGMITLNVTFASSAPSTVTEEMIVDMGISTEVSYLVTSLFLLGYVFGSVLWGSGSELFGRRPIILLTLTSYTLLSLGQTLGTTITTVLITRFLAGFFAVAPLVVVGGIIADIWPVVGRGPASALFAACVSLGPCIGPVVGGFIADSDLSWRWVFWVVMIFAGSCTVLMVVALPETYGPVLLLEKTRRLRKADPIKYGNIKSEHETRDHSLKGLLNITLYRPFKMLSMEPILVLITLYMSIVYGVLYALFEAFPLIFINTYHFTSTQSGLIFIGVGIGALLAASINMFFGRSYPALTRKWRGCPPPEKRLYGAMLGAPTLVIGSFWVGWTGNYESVRWYVPAIGTVVIGMGINLIFISFLSYLVDTYLAFSASALAANALCRSLVGAAFPLFTVQMYNKLGINWATTLMGLIALVFVPSPFLFYKYGQRIRMRSRFAPCFDLKLKDEVEEEERRARFNGGS